MSCCCFPPPAAARVQLLQSSTIIDCYLLSRSALDMSPGSSLSSLSSLSSPSAQAGAIAALLGALKVCSQRIFLVGSDAGCFDSLPAASGRKSWREWPVSRPGCDAKEKPPRTSDIGHAWVACRRRGLPYACNAPGGPWLKGWPMDRSASHSVTAARRRPTGG